MYRKVWDTQPRYGAPGQIRCPSGVPPRRDNRRLLQIKSAYFHAKSGRLFSMQLLLNWLVGLLQTMRQKKRKKKNDLNAYVAGYTEYAQLVPNKSLLKPWSYAQVRMCITTLALSVALASGSWRLVTSTASLTASCSVSKMPRQRNNSKYSRWNAPADRNTAATRNLYKATYTCKTSHRQNLGRVVQSPIKLAQG